MSTILRCLQCGRQYEVSGETPRQPAQVLARCRECNYPLVLSRAEPAPFESAGSSPGNAGQSDAGADLHNRASNDNFQQASGEYQKSPGSNWPQTSQARSTTPAAATSPSSAAPRVASARLPRVPWALWMYLATVLTIIFTIGILLFGLLINEFFRDYAIPVLAGIMIVGGILTALGGMDVFRHVPNFSLRFEASPIILLAITLLHVLVNLMKVPKAKQVRAKWGLLLMAMGFGLAFGSLWSLIVAITCR